MDLGKEALKVVLENSQNRRQAVATWTRFFIMHLQHEQCHVVLIYIIVKSLVLHVHTYNGWFLDKWAFNHLKDD